MKILITGGSGFLASHIADRLSSEGHQVTILDIRESEFLRKDQQFILANIKDYESIYDAISGVDFVYHFAAVADINKTVEEPAESIHVNILGTLNLLEACRKHGTKRFIFASSVYVQSKTGSFYRVAKHSCEMMIEEYARRFSLEYTILRFGTLYGKRSDHSNSVRNYILQALKQRKITLFGTGEEVREYIHVYDAAEISLEILSQKYSGKTMVLTGPHRVKLKDLIDMINEILGGDVEIEYGQNKDAHYKLTPYSYEPNTGTKIVLNTYQDLGQGLVEMMSELDTHSSNDTQ